MLPYTCPTYVDFGIFESHLQIVVDSLIGDLANERQVRYTDLLLLSALEYSLADLGLAPSAVRRLSIAGILFPASAFGDGLPNYSQ